MKKIELKQLSLSNFKGIKSLTINFNNDLTDILGDNGTGKTTVFDAFTWLLFGKDHNDSSKFEIKTLDKNNNAYEKLNHEVEAKLMVENNLTTIRRVYKEKWVKQKGSIEPVLTGHVTQFFYNDVPIKLSEFNEKINEIIKEDLFKLLTNPFNFNSLPWQLRRDILTKIASISSDKDIASSNQDFIDMLNESNGKSLNEFKKQISAAKKRIKNEMDEIPTRIDEITRTIPQEEDWEAIRLEISEKNDRAEKIVEKIIDISKVDTSKTNEIKHKQQDVLAYEMQLNTVASEIRKEYVLDKNEREKVVYDKKIEINNVEREIDNLKTQIDSLYSERRSLESKMVRMREQFKEIQSKKLEYAENEFSCPTCNREFEPFQIVEKKEEMQRNFNIKKSVELEEINDKGLKHKKEHEKLNELIKVNESKQAVLETNLKTLQAELVQITKDEIVSFEERLKESDLYAQHLVNVENAKKEVSELRNSIQKPNETLIKELESERDKLLSDVKLLNSRLYKENIILENKKRVDLLNDRLSSLAQELATLEKKEYTIEQFVSIKMNEIEVSVNKMFPSVKFKMFCEQLNGGVSECCETLVNGVPFTYANNAGKIKAGIEIINVLSEHYGSIAPIFVDNAESIVEIPYTRSQLIRLIVSENHKSLTIN